MISRPRGRIQTMAAVRKTVAIPASSSRFLRAHFQTTIGEHYATDRKGDPVAFCVRGPRCECSELCDSCRGPSECSVRPTSEEGSRNTLAGSVRTTWIDEGVSQGAIAVGEGAVFVAGGVQSETVDFSVRSHDTSDGRRLWSDVFDHSGGTDIAIGVTSAGGRLFAVGGANLDADSSQIPLIRVYDRSSGQTLWEQEVTDGQGVFDSSVVSRGTLIAVGGNTEWLVYAYDAASGTPLWQHRSGLDGGNRAIDVAHADGRAFVVGRETLSNGFSTWLVRAYDTDSGAVLWEDRPADELFGQAQSVAVEGDIVLAVGSIGRSMDTWPFVDTDWRLRAYHAQTGELLWQDEPNKGGFFFPEGASEVVVRDNRAFVAGTGGVGCGLRPEDPHNCDFIVRAYRLETGRLLWEDQRDDGPFDVATAISLDDDGVVVAGFGGSACDITATSNCDMLLRAYKPAGGVRWQDRVRRPATDDVAQGVAAGNGRVFLSGLLYDTDFSVDTLVRAYASRPKTR